jgi:flagellar biosynthesis protein FlhG
MSLANSQLQTGTAIHQRISLGQVPGDKKQASVIAITSGKGGVGKTNIAANLAICLAASHKKVVLVDADFGLANLDVILNINSKYNISHVLNGSKSLEEISQTGPAGVEIICGASGLESLAEISQFQRQRLVDELARMQDNADAIIIDTAAGINKSVLGFCLASDHVLVVTTPEPTAMTDAYAMIKVIASHDYNGRVSLIVNMASSISEGRKVYQQIADVVRRFVGIQIYEAGVLIKDEKLSVAVRKRRPVVLAFPRSYISSSIIALAARMAKCSAAKVQDRGFFRKLADWFLGLY